MSHAQLPPNDNNVGAYRDPQGRVPYLLMPGDRVMQCPYDPNHYTLEPRFIWHLTRCREQYLRAIESGRRQVTPDEMIQVCTFNSTHHVKNSELQAHLDSCPSAK